MVETTTGKWPLYLLIGAGIALGLAGFLLFSTTPVLNQLSLPAWYSRIFQFYFEQRHISFAIFFLLAILIVEFSAGRRLWCRYICPQSFLPSGAKISNSMRLKVRFDPDRCLCKKAMIPARKPAPCRLIPKRWPILLKPNAIIAVIVLSPVKSGDKRLGLPLVAHAAKKN